MQNLERLTDELNNTGNWPSLSEPEVLKIKVLLSIAQSLEPIAEQLDVLAKASVHPLEGCAHDTGCTCYDRGYKEGYDDGEQAPRRVKHDLNNP